MVSSSATLFSLYDIYDSAYTSSQCSAFGIINSLIVDPSNVQCCVVLREGRELLQDYSRSLQSGSTLRKERLKGKVDDPPRKASVKWR